MFKSFRGSCKFFVALILNWGIHKTIRYHHEDTKDTKGSDIYTLKLRELRAFVVSPFFLCPLWLNLFFPSVAALPEVHD